MATTRIKEKISTLVSSQLPEFIRSDYETFTTFIQAYYEFLEQDQGAQEVLQNIRSYRDIDTTIDSFIEYFIKQYCDSIPRNLLHNKRALVKRIEDLYNSKGSENAYRLLFRLLYNKDIDFIYPYQQVLKASDGKWIQDTSFFMRTITGDSSTIIGKELLIKSSTTTYPIRIKNRKNTSTSTGIVSNVHEYFYDNSKNVPVNIGDVIEVGGFKGEVVSAVTSAVIVSPGVGFKVGDILPLTAGVGNAAKLKVTKVNSTGGILNVQFLSYGIGYLTEFYNFFSSSISTPPVTSFTYSGGAAAITDSTGGFVDYGTITTSTYAEIGYFAADYSGEVLRQFFTDASFSSSANFNTSSTTSSLSGTSPDAVILIRLGSTTRYQGYYATTDGFLSDYVYLEDQNYFQPFSYVIKVDERLSDYKKVLLDLLHPAGTKLFGNFTINADIDVGTELVTALRFLTSYFQDQIKIDDLVTKHVGKVPPVEIITTDETVTKVVLKPVSDSSLVDDSTLSRSLLRPLSNSAILSEVVSYTLAKPVSDSTIIIDNVTIVGINNFTATADSAIATDSGYVFNNNYSDPATTYFNADYAGSISTF